MHPLVRVTCRSILAFLLGGLALCKAASPEADLIVTNAKIWTGERSHPEVEALVVIGERIVATGSHREALHWQGSRTRIFDAHGGRIVPGFNDAHVHFADGGASLDAVQLNDAHDAREFVSRLAAYARTRAPGQWILAGEWDETKWPSAELPTRQMIDAVTPNNPVAIDRYDGHMVLANSLALAQAGIDANTPDPDGGIVVRDATGQPTGTLKDAAIPLLTRAIPNKSHAERRAAIERALQHAAALGVTSVQDMNPAYADIGIYSELLREHKLTTRIYVAPAIATVEDQAKLDLGHGFGSSFLRLGALKAYADGSLGSRTAYFFEPYTDQADNRGLLADTMHPISRTRDYFLQADDATLQVCTHAIGDAAISTVLDLYEDVARQHGAKDRRWRVEHAQHMAAKDFERFATLDVIASMQPYQAIDDGRWADSRIGTDRAHRTYAFRTFLDHHVHLAFGTDWPVVPLDPMLGLYAATTRATLDGRHPEGWIPEQKLTIEEALATYTAGSAYAEFQDTDKGTLAAGKLADFVLLNEDVLVVPASHLPRVRVIRTWVGGREVYAPTR